MLHSANFLIRDDETMNWKGQVKFIAQILGFAT